MGQILRINLSHNQITKEKLSEYDAKKFLGGRGLAAKILCNELKPGIDPLGPENKLVYAAGPFSATGFPLNSRWLVAAKSPLTGIWGEATCGGNFSIQLRKAGYEALIIEGVSSNPTYIGIHDDDITFREASNLWGKPTLETELTITQELGLTHRRESQPSVICIGPAGENLVKIASIMHTAHRAAGRTGLGAVMGSKKLKAITIEGTKHVPVAQPKKLTQFNTNVKNECSSNNNLLFFREHGQAGAVPRLQEMGMLPTKNFQQSTYEYADAISGQTMSATILKNRSTCSDCPIACKRDVEIIEGQYAPVDPRYGGPEYENVAALGSLILINNLEAISKMNQMCNALGIDIISTGVIIAWLMECAERGLVTPADLDGINVSWGNIESVFQLITKISSREGVGDLLAEGVKKAAATIGRGSSRYAVEVKGLEIPMHEPRAKKGLGLSYATSLRGGCHMQAFHDPDFENGNTAPEIGIIKRLDRHDTSRDKVEAIIRSQDWVAVTNSLLLCTSPAWVGYDYLKPRFITQTLNLITGWNLTPNDLLVIGERINNLCRYFNAREGFTRKDDYLPPRFIYDPLPDGPSKGQRISKNEFDKMLNYYYDLRGWDQITGNPPPQKLQELDLNFT